MVIYRAVSLLGSRNVGLVAAAFIMALFMSGFAAAAPKSKEIAFWNDSEEQSILEVDHSLYDQLLKKYVRVGHASGVNRFDYAAVGLSDKAKLEQYLNYMQALDPRQLTKLRQKAYWLNLFNAVIINEVIEAEAEDSIRELGRGLWRANRLYITMQKTSLDDIEHGILRPIFNDPRVHFSLAAGTVGSASILSQAFTAENIEELLEKNTVEFLNHERGVTFDEDNTEATLGAILIQSRLS